MNYITIECDCLNNSLISAQISFQITLQFLSISWTIPPVMFVQFDRSHFSLSIQY